MTTRSDMCQNCRVRQWRHQHHANGGRLLCCRCHMGFGYPADPSHKHPTCAESLPAVRINGTALHEAAR